jgi:hypothetical protein
MEDLLYQKPSYQNENTCFIYLYINIFKKSNILSKTFNVHV